MRHVSVIILCGPGGNNRVLDEMKGTTTSLGTVNSLEEVMGKRRMHGHALEAALCTWDSAAHGQDGPGHCGWLLL